MSLGLLISQGFIALGMLLQLNGIKTAGDSTVDSDPAFGPLTGDAMWADSSAGRLLIPAGSLRG